jgi:methionyl-tRNA formyltransferase
MRIIFMGSGDFGCDSLTGLHSSMHEIAEVITQPAKPAGRGKALRETAIATLADKLGLNCVEQANVNEQAFVGHIRKLKPDVIVVIAFGQKIGNELLNMPGCRCINLHGSLLPAYRGAAPINRAIMNGEKYTGITVIELNEKWDGGAILGTRKVSINSNETAGELHDKLARLGPELILEVLTKIEQGTITPLPQDDSQACYARKLTKSDGAICWSKTAEEIRNHIHGTWPWPGAYCKLQLQGKNKLIRVNIARAKVVQRSSESSEDSVSDMPDKTSVNKTVKLPCGVIANDMSIVCKDDTRLQLLEVKPENSRLMSFEDFVNGRHLKPGDRFIDG